MKNFGKNRILLLGGLIVVALFSLGFLMLKGKTVKPEEVSTGNKEEIPEEAAKATTRAMLLIEPSYETFQIGETKTLELKLTFSDGSAEEKLSYFKTEISFPKDYLLLPAESYPDVSSAPFNKIFRVDGPVVANETGKIAIELGMDSPGTGPATNQSYTVARLSFQGKANTLQSENISIGATQLVNDSAKEIEVIPQGAGFMVE